MSETSVAKGAWAGLAAGLVASLAMDLFQRGVQAMSSKEEEDEPATEKAADRVSEVATGEPLPDDHKAAGGQLVHYLAGAGIGLAYGIAAELRPETTAGFGTVVSGGVAAMLDEGAVPALGLGPAPWDSAMGTHAYTAASHLVFGVVAEAVRRAIRS